MIVLLWLLFWIFLTPRLVEAARRQAERGLVGSMEGHAEMDSSVTEGPILKRAAFPEGLTSISQYFVMVGPLSGNISWGAYSLLKAW